MLDTWRGGGRSAHTVRARPPEATAAIALGPSQSFSRSKSTRRGAPAARATCELLATPPPAAPPERPGGVGARPPSVKAGMPAAKRGKAPAADAAQPAAAAVGAPPTPRGAAHAAKSGSGASAASLVVCVLLALGAREGFARWRAAVQAALTPEYLAPPSDAPAVPAAGARTRRRPRCTCRFISLHLLRTLSGRDAERDGRESCAAARSRRPPARPHAGAAHAGLRFCADLRAGSSLSALDFTAHAAGDCRPSSCSRSHVVRRHDAHMHGHRCPAFERARRDRVSLARELILRAHRPRPLTAGLAAPHRGKYRAPAAARRASCRPAPSPPHEP